MYEGAYQATDMLFSDFVFKKSGIVFGWCAFCFTDDTLLNSVDGRPSFIYIHVFNSSLFVSIVLSLITVPMSLCEEKKKRFYKRLVFVWISRLQVLFIQNKEHKAVKVY